MERVKQAAKKYFKYVEVREGVLTSDLFYDKGFNASGWVVCEWQGGDWFLDAYFEGLSMFGDELYLSFPSEVSFFYWCEGARYRPKELDSGNFFFIKENVDAIANMASNMLDGGAGLVSDGPFEVEKFVRFSQLWSEPFEPEKMAEWVEKVKPVFKGWRDLKRLLPEYTFDGWSISAWVEVNVANGEV